MISYREKKLVPYLHQPCQHRLSLLPIWKFTSKSYKICYHKTSQIWFKMLSRFEMFSISSTINYPRSLNWLSYWLCMSRAINLKYFEPKAPQELAIPRISPIPKGWCRSACGLGPEKSNRCSVDWSNSHQLRISLLKTKEQSLIKELEHTRSTIAWEENNLLDLPETIDKMKEYLVVKIQSVRFLHHSIQFIHGSVEANQHEIDQVNQIRLPALNMVEQLVQSM